MIALAVSGAWAATESNWKDTSVGGSEESPYDISDAANWSNGVGGGHHLNFDVSSLTYMTNTASITTRVGDDFRVNSGDFVFLGPIYCYKWCNNTANARSSVLKKGDWTVDNYGVRIGSGAGTTVAFTNETGNANITGARNNDSILSVAAGEGATVEVVKESGDWSVSKTAFIGNGKNSTARFYNRGGFLTAAKYGVCVGDTGGGTTGSAYLEISGGAITNTYGSLSIGDGNSAGTAEVRVNGGEYCAQAGWVVVGSQGRATLTIDSGRVIAPASGVVFCNLAACVSGRDCFLNLNSGMLETKTVTYGAGSAAATFTFNGGTLKALQAGTLIEAKDNLTVTVDAGGGTIDSGNYAIAIAEDLGGTGGMTFSGGSTITLGGAISYTGGTTVEAGTVVVVPDVAARTALGAITVTGLANSVCEVVRLSGAGYFSAGDLPADTADTTFRVSPDGKSILAANGMETAFWIGGNGDLGTASNWSNGAVPTGNPATISWMSPITLTNSGTFAPSSITFDGPASVTVDGDDITGVVAVTNLSSVSHTINAKVYFVGDIQVKQAAMAEAGDLTKAHVTFAGGAYAAPDCSLENGDFDPIYSRCIFGKYYLASTAENPWTVAVSKTGFPNALADGSSLYIPYAGDMRELYIGNRAKVDVGDLTMLAGGHISLRNFGEMVVTNVTMTGTRNRFMSYGQRTATPGVFKFNSVTNEMSSNWFYFADAQNTASKHVFYIGEGGLNYSHDNAIYCLGRNNDGNYETIRPWYSDFTIADRGNSGGALAICREVEFCTDDENDVGRKITIDAITMANDTPAITVSGKGTLQVNNGNVNIQQPPITVKDSATLAFGANGSLGTGDITLGAGTTLALTATSSQPEKLIVNTLNLPTEGKAKLRIDGVRLRSGNHVIATLGNDATTANVELDGNSAALDGRKATLRVDGGNLILNIEPNGTLIIIR